MNVADETDSTSPNVSAAELVYVGVVCVADMEDSILPNTNPADPVNSVEDIL